MTVFISHKQGDTALAKACSLWLMTSGVPFYLDVLDESIGDAADITNHLLRKIEQCSHLIAVVTKHTQESWWVPFEIGAASVLDKRICSVVRGSVDQPDFLSKWPRLDAGIQNDWKEFSTRYFEDTNLLGSALDSVQSRVRTADRFHRSLKKALGQ